MKTWINHPVNLEGNLVRLTGLERGHFSELELLSKEKSIWDHYTVDGSDSKTLIESLDHGIAERKSGTQYPFVIFHKEDNKLIGSTRFLDVTPAHRKLEIGWTWLHPDYWGSIVNLECKLLLLRYCFTVLNTRRVLLKTDVNNSRSRKAIEKIGAKFEGIIRKDMIRYDGTDRTSAYYSILDEEWNEVEKQLLERLNHVLKFGK